MHPTLLEMTYIYVSLFVVMRHQYLFFQVLRPEVPLGHAMIRGSRDLDSSAGSAIYGCDSGQGGSPLWVLVASAINQA